MSGRKRAEPKTEAGDEAIGESVEKIELPVEGWRHVRRLAAQLTVLDEQRAVLMQRLRDLLDAMPSGTEGEASHE